jgi:hypothetical protein
MASGRPDLYFETHWTGNNNSHMGEEYSSFKSLSSFVFSMSTKKRSMYWKQFSQLMAIFIVVLYLIKVKSIETVSQRHFSWLTISPTLEGCLFSLSSCSLKEGNQQPWLCFIGKWPFCQRIWISIFNLNLYITLVYLTTPYNRKLSE